MLVNKEDIINKTLEAEGGLVNHKNDKGGLTNYGITFNLYKRYFPEARAYDFVRMTREQAYKFYEKAFYENYKLDKIPAAIRDIFYDMSVNHGIRNATVMLQKSLTKLKKRVIIDGIIGPNTLAAAEDISEAQLFRKTLNDTRAEFYTAIIRRDPSQMVFKRGWFNRIDKFRDPEEKLLASS